MKAGLVRVASAATDAALGDVRTIDAKAFLRRLGFDEIEPPSVAALHRLHRAFVERVPYEVIDIQLERPTTLDPFDATDRIVRSRRGGYCFHLNGAFSTLLAALGYRVGLHRAGVQNHTDQQAGIFRNHLALTVEGLPDQPDAAWLVDVGLGDALYEPLPLGEGTYRQGPFNYSLRPSEIAPGGWRFEHDARGSFRGMDFEPEPASMSDFAERHEHLSHSPESGFVRVFTAQRRDAHGVDILRALTLSRLDAGSRPPSVLESPEKWYAALADIFGLTLDDLSSADRDRLWCKVVAQHEKHVNQPAASVHAARGA
ncbi:MAG TPA: arylamine N-acetyltransferase [Polyangiaceae bacterium]|nr:arylamine N-acetyltransferase [Polyangiaceae bacterium]